MSMLLSGYQPKAVEVNKAGVKDTLSLKSTSAHLLLP